MQEGQYVQYPRPPVKEIDFGVISEGFNLIWRNLLPFGIASFCSMLVVIGVSQLTSLMLVPILGDAPTNTTDLSLLYAYIGKQYAFSIPINVLSGAVVSPFYLAMAMMALKLARGQTVDVNDAFSGFSRFGQVFGLYVLVQLAVYIGFLFCCFPMFILGGLLMFAMPIMADRNIGPVEAIKESVLLLKDHWLMATLFYFVIGLCSGLGVLACCVGIIVSMPLLYVCPVLVYRDFTMGKGMPVPVEAPVAPVTPPESSGGASYDYPPQSNDEGTPS